MSPVYLVKAAGEYLATGSRYETWTDEQRHALRFATWERAFDCAEAWRSGPGGKKRVRVVRLANGGDK